MTDSEPAAPEFIPDHNAPDDWIADVGDVRVLIFDAAGMGDVPKRWTVSWGHHRARFATADDAKAFVVDNATTIAAGEAPPASD